MNKEFIKKLANEILSTRTIEVDELFEHPFAKIAMTAGELIFRTNQRSIKYAKGCISTTKKNDPKNGRWTFSVRCNQNWSKGPYDVRFKLVPGKGSKTQGMLGREVEVSCNCNAWKYNGADFNALDKDYSERQYSDGQPPNKRDPQRRYLICKHVAASIPLFKKFIVPEGFKEPEPKKIAPIKLKPKTLVTPEKKLPIEKQHLEKKPVEKKPLLRQLRIPQTGPSKVKQPQTVRPTKIGPIRPGQKP